MAPLKYPLSIFLVFRLLEIVFGAFSLYTDKIFSYNNLNTYFRIKKMLKIYSIFLSLERK
jgi:ABC-type uncharacterized transport system permease subunit